MQLTMWWLVINLMLPQGGHESRYIHSYSNEAACRQAMMALASEKQNSATCEVVQTYKLFRGRQSEA